MALHPDRRQVGDPIPDPNRQDGPVTATDLIAELVDAGSYAVGRGLVNASGGNLSARLPDDSGFVVTGTGTWLDRLTADDFATVNDDGRHVGGPRPSGEWLLHARTYAARPDVRAIVHLHPQHAVLVDALGHGIRLVTLDHAYYLREVVRIPFLPSGSEALADAAAGAVADGHDALVLAHHGCSALGDSVRMALRRAANLEEAATMTYRLLLLGDTTVDFPPDYRDRIIEV
jgi:L-fuculose-phosphate aldolase